MENWVDKLRAYLLVSLIIFASSALLGCYVGLAYPDLTENFVEKLRESFAPLSDQDPLQLALIILLNNAVKCLGAVLLGPLFGLAPIALGTINGFVLGLVSIAVSEARGSFYIVVAIAPHGVLEVPAMLLSIAIGLREGWLLVRKLNGEKVELKREVKAGLSLYVKLVLPLLIAAAFTESFITPLLMEIIF